MDTLSFNKELFRFLKNSTTPFHAVSTLKRELERHHFTHLDEADQWDLEQGKKYYFYRNGSLAALSLGSESDALRGFRIIGSHTDSPSLQLKPHSKQASAPYLIAGVETYGGAILNTWFDRELSLAGRISYSTDKDVHKNSLIDFSRPVAYIPNLAIHLNRSINDGQKVNPQTHLSPILSETLNEQIPDLESSILRQLKIENPEVLPEHLNGFDLFCYDPSDPVYFGLENEFIAAPRLDNLASCFIGLKSILKMPAQTNILLLCTNHEEVGSRTNSGALGNFAESLLTRMFETDQQRLRSLHNSVLLSLDNAHATHPNYQDTSDGDHTVLLNKGPVIKLNANQRYCTSAITASIMRILARELDVECQNFVMRSDMSCGSTIGPLTSAQLGVAAIDMGIPTWGMHSIREVTGTKDPLELFKLVAHFASIPELPPFHS